MHCDATWAGIVDKSDSDNVQCCAQAVLQPMTGFTIYLDEVIKYRSCFRTRRDTVAYGI